MFWGRRTVLRIKHTPTLQIVSVVPDLYRQNIFTSNIFGDSAAVIDLSVIQIDNLKNLFSLKLFKKSVQWELTFYNPNKLEFKRGRIENSISIYMGSDCYTIASLMFSSMSLFLYFTKNFLTVCIYCVHTVVKYSSTILKRVNPPNTHPM